MPDDGRRYELLEGRIVLSPAPKWRHQRIVTKLLAFRVRGETAGFGVTVTAPTDVVFDPEDSAAEPDLLFIASDRMGIITEDNVQGAPDLLVEVLSPPTAHRDFGVKMRTYARFGVRWYWIADPDEDALHVFELRDGAHVETAILREGDTLACPLFPGVTAPVGDIFLSFR